MQGRLTVGEGKEGRGVGQFQYLEIKEIIKPKDILSVVRIMLLQKLQQLDFIQTLIEKIFAVFDDLMQSASCYWLLTAETKQETHLETDVAIVCKINAKQRAAEHGTV